MFEYKSWVFANWNERTDEQNQFWWEHCYVETPQLHEFLYAPRPVALVAPPYTGRTISVQALKRFQTRPLFIEYDLTRLPNNDKQFAYLISLLVERLLDCFIKQPTLWESLKNSQIKFWHWLAQKYLPARLQRRYRDFLDDYKIEHLAVIDEELLELNDGIPDDQKEICQDLHYLLGSLKMPVTVFVDFCKNQPLHHQALQTLLSFIDYFEPDLVRFNLLLPDVDEIKKIIYHGRSGKLLFQYLEPISKTAITLAEKYLQIATNQEINSFYDLISAPFLKEIENNILDIYGSHTLSGWLHWAETLVFIKAHNNQAFEDFTLAKSIFYERHLSLTLDIERQGICCGPKYIKLSEQLFVLAKTLFQRNYAHHDLIVLFGNEANLHQAIRRLRKEIEPNPDSKQNVYVQKHSLKGYILQHKISPDS